MRKSLSLLLLCVAGLVHNSTAQESTVGNPFDWVLTGGQIVDGTGTKPRRTDIGIRDGRIAAVGNLSNAPAQQRLDATGLLVAPGFVDVHAHADTATERRPTADNFVQMGVTTIVTGNCGRSAARLDAHLRRLEKGGVSLNYASLVGHGTLRQAVLGTADRQASAVELRAMQDGVDEAMRAGAVGLSTGLIYVPGTYSDTAELIALCRVVSKHGGVYATHMRNENNTVLDAIDEALRIGAEAELAVHISHIKASGRRNHGRSREILARLDAARAAGRKVTADQYAYAASSTGMEVLFPSSELEIGRKEFAEALDKDPAFRKRMHKALFGTMEHAGFGDLSYARIAYAPGTKGIDGKTIPEVAQQLLGKSDKDTQAEAVLQITERAKGRRVSMIYHTMSETDVHAFMTKDYIAIASDSGIRSASGASKPHPRGAGNNPRVLARFVRDAKLLSLPAAVRKMTSLPANVFGLEGRGRIAVGAWADLVVFDPDKIVDRATFAEPRRFPAGIRAVIVNGKLVVDNGSHTGARPGHVLRHGRAPQEAR